MSGGAREPAAWLKAAAVTTGAALAVAASASAAAHSPTDVTVRAAPVPRTHAPHPHPLSLSFRLAVGTDSTGHPARPVRTAITTIPPGVADELRSFRPCRPGLVLGDHSATPPRCPRRSLLGRGSVSVYIATFGFATASNRTAIIYTGHRHVYFWWHEPTYGLAGTVEGVVTPGPRGRGASLRWDFSPYSQGAFTGDNPVSVVTFDTKFTHRSRRHTPFEAAACGKGSWKFSTSLTFGDGSSQTVRTSVPCGARVRRRAKATEGSGTAPLGPPGCGSPVCLPLAGRASVR